MVHTCTSASTQFFHYATSFQCSALSVNVIILPSEFHGYAVHDLRKHPRHNLFFLNWQSEDALRLLFPVYTFSKKYPK